MALALACVVFSPAAQAAGAVSAGSPSFVVRRQLATYLQSSARANDQSSTSTITSATAPSLKPRWQFTAGDGFSAQPIVANRLIYSGSWDGYERATTLQGQPLWSTYLGQTTATGCDSTPFGIASTPLVAYVTTPIGPQRRAGAPLPRELPGSVLYVGGGDARFYALDAFTGKILWSTRLGPSPAAFIWSSPALSNGSLYVGLASFGDCPLVQGQLVRLDAVTGAILGVFKVVPDGCTGGGVWGSPAIDTAGIAYFATGNGGDCATAEPYASSVVAVRLSDLSLVASWQIPASQQVGDGDFGSTPTLFTVGAGAGARALLGVASKNGYYYAFDRATIAAGPIWEDQIAAGGGCPECGDGSISPSAWDGSTLYVAGGNTTVAGASCKGSVRALDPATGAYRWQRCLTEGAVLSPVTVGRGILVVGDGFRLLVLSSSTGQPLFTYDESTNYYPFWAAATLTGNTLLAPNTDGTFYAFSL